MLGETIAKIAHDVVAVGPKADDDSGGAEDEDPDGDGGFLGQFAGVPDEVDGGEGADGIGDVIGAVGEGSHGGGQDLQEGIEMFGLVVEMRGMGVDCLDVA